MGETCGKYVGEEVCIRGFSLGNLRERGQLVDLAVNGAITLYGFWRSRPGGRGLNWRSVRWWRFSDYLRNCQLLKQDCAP
jgi:hypothetical protein